MTDTRASEAMCREHFRLLEYQNLEEKKHVLGRFSRKLSHLLNYAIDLVFS